MKPTYEPMPYGTVLVVDDVESNAFVAKRMMAPYELTIETAMSGREALEKIKNGKTYDLVLLDHLMPEMDGIETVKQMRRSGYKRPVVALTASDDVEHPELFMDSGFDGAIAKPIDAQTLGDTLKKYIRDIHTGEASYEHNNHRERRRRTAAAEHTPASPLVIRAFLRDAKKAAQTMEEMLKGKTIGDDEIKSFTTCVHGVKSGLANVNELSMSETAYRLEQAGRGNDLSVVNAETPAFLEELEKLIARLDTKDEEDSGDVEATDVDYAHLHRQLQAVITACSIFDKATIKATLAGLKEKKWPRPITEQLNTMGDLLLSGDYDEVSQTAGEIIKLK